MAEPDERDDSLVETKTSFGDPDYLKLYDAKTALKGKKRKNFFNRDLLFVRRLVNRTGRYIRLDDDEEEPGSGLTTNSDPDSGSNPDADADADDDLEKLVYPVSSIVAARKSLRESAHGTFLPMVVGTETELALKYGKALDPTKASKPPAFIIEALFPWFLKKIGENHRAFVRNPHEPWLREDAHQFTKDRIGRLTQAAIENNRIRLAELDDNTRRLIEEARIEPRDVYMGEVGVFLENACRIYVDGSHLELCTAECRDPHSVICFEKALEKSVEAVRPGVEQIIGRELAIFKDNTDRKGNSYACHENFLLRRQFFDEIYEGRLWSWTWATFLVTSIIYTGAGKVGSETAGQPCDYQISQRADHFSRMFGVDTMTHRPIINLRCEPLADDEKWGRFHVILSDSNMAEWSNYLKVGTKILVLNMLQEHFFNRIKNKDYTNCILRWPVLALRQISRDLTCLNKYELSNGAKASPIEIQRHWLKCVDHFYKFEWDGHCPGWIYDIIKKWGQMLDWLEKDDDRLETILDWRIKKSLIECFIAKCRMQNRRISWQDDRVRAIDVQYHDISASGFYNRLLVSGNVERIVQDGDIEKAMSEPPTDTRAWARGQFIKNWLEHLVDVSWELVVLRLKIGDFTPLVKINLEPLSGTRWLARDLFRPHLSFESFCRAYAESQLNKKSPF